MKNTWKGLTKTDLECLCFDKNITSNANLGDYFGITHQAASLGVLKVGAGGIFQKVKLLNMIEDFYSNTTFLEEGEEISSIEGFGRHFVTNYGRILKIQQVTKFGHKLVKITEPKMHVSRDRLCCGVTHNDGRHLRLYPHRLVAKYFLNAQQDHDVGFKNGNIYDLHVNNITTFPSKWNTNLNGMVLY